MNNHPRRTLGAGEFGFWEALFCSAATLTRTGRAGPTLHSKKNERVWNLSRERADSPAQICATATQRTPAHTPLETHAQHAHAPHPTP
eukprot:CAMPEP_0183374488 /NCGR_PEP_ID=MMETSP0164_2-20130417/114656_1 /TAXON_ID=221442 /ORGANISM="Coccolithus pelagicus ssp braarudi, Strain PLY182g" /LENGTH=87 /DNA_ID=CAMNT_0025551529 /DNA_START=212 /DNA_END=472 /DNA_ORIENTATION=-